MSRSNREFRSAYHAEQVRQKREERKARRKRLRANPTARTWTWQWPGHTDRMSRYQRPGARKQGGGR